VHVRKRPRHTPVEQALFFCLQRVSVVSDRSKTTKMNFIFRRGRMMRDMNLGCKEISVHAGAILPSFERERKHMKNCTTGACSG
jgi:hypothetical protein